MKLTPWLLLLSCLSLTACSGSKSAQKVNEETPQIELSDADEFIEGPSDATIADDSESISMDEPVVASQDTSEVIEDSAPELGMESTSSSPEVPVVASSYEAGSMKQYTVQKNETLMLIAFKLYGDYEKWKELANHNRTALKGNTNITEGMVLNYMSPAEEFVWNPQGLPYLIRTGDTLGGISTNVYATSKKWKLIWDNNRPLIKDPNRIFAGFTIYYLENGREVASQL